MSSKPIALTLGALLAGAVALTTTASTALADSHHEGEVEGVVTDRAGTCPNLTFTVLGTKVTTNASTKFEDGNCNDLVNGRKIEVKVPLQPVNGAFSAAKVDFKGR